MLVVESHVDGVITIGDAIEVLVVAVGSRKVRLGITAPRDVPIHRTDSQKHHSQRNAERTREVYEKETKTNNGE